MPKVQCAMCNELVEISQSQADALAAGRKRRKRSKLEDVYCLKHTKMAIMKYDAPERRSQHDT